MSLFLQEVFRMTNEKDLELIREYEELIILLKQLHEDTPVLEKQHESIREAFVKAQKRLDTSMKSSEKTLEEMKEKIKIDFSEECNAILADLMKSTQNQVSAWVAQIQTEKNDLMRIYEQCNSSLLKLDTASDRAEQILGALNSKVDSVKIPYIYDDKTISKDKDVKSSKKVRTNIEFNYDETLTGAEIWKKYKGATSLPIIVQAPTWTGDYCYVITEYDKAKKQVKGRIYLNGKLRTTKGYPNGHRTFTDKTEFKLYKSPNEQSIIINELELKIDDLG